MKAVTLEQYASLPRPNIQWVVDNLIPRPGLVMLMGPPKAGKSFLALDVAVRISRGEPVFGHASTPTTVLYLQLDTSEAVWRDRIKRLDAAGYNIKAPRMLMIHPQDEIHPVNIMTAAGAGWLRQALATTKPGLVVIDVLREIHTGEENDSTEMKRVFDELSRILAGRSILFVHHTRKIPRDAERIDPVEVARGSSYITGKMDAYWLLYDGWLHLTSRFEENRALRVKQQPHGVFQFPDIDVLLAPNAQATSVPDPALSSPPA